MRDRKDLHWWLTAPTASFSVLAASLARNNLFAERKLIWNAVSLDRVCKNRKNIYGVRSFLSFFFSSLSCFWLWIFPLTSRICFPFVYFSYLRDQNFERICGCTKENNVGECKVKKEDKFQSLLRSYAQAYNLKTFGYRAGGGGWPRKKWTNEVKDTLRKY